MITFKFALTGCRSSGYFMQNKDITNDD